MVNGITVYDDFAHHPTAIDTTVAGLRRKVGNARILAVLEPRSNTMKLGVMKDALPGSLKDADLVFCYAGNLGWDARGALAPLGSKAVVEEDLDALIDRIAAAARPGDHILVMSNGGFGGIHEKLLKQLQHLNHSGAYCPDPAPGSCASACCARSRAGWRLRCVARWCAATLAGSGCARTAW